MAFSKSKLMIQPFFIFTKTYFMAHVAREVFQGNKQEEMTNIKDNEKASSIQAEFSKPKTNFMHEFEQGITIEESRKKVHEKIDGLWSK